MEKINFKINEKKKEGIILTKQKTQNNTKFNIKLNNGYNIILNENQMTDIKITNINKKTQNEKNSQNTKTTQNNKKNTNKTDTKILILHTGGTIASKIDYETGAVNPKFNPEEIIQMFPEISEISEIETELVSNVASDDIRFFHFNLLIQKIAEKEKNYNGIIITCGTDNLHYLSCALHFGLNNLKIPILIVGSQRSSDRPSSDAFLNLASAIKFIKENQKQKNRFLDVGICMHKTSNDNICNILHAVNAKKNHSSKRDAFKSINKQEIANIDFYNNKIEYNQKDKQLNLTNYEKIKNTKTQTNLYKENLKIGILKIHPNFYPEEIMFYKNFDGLIIEATGLGHIPISQNDQATKTHPQILENIKNLSSKIPVIITTQTTNGKVNLNIYSPGTKLKNAGIIGNYNNLTSESSFIKLAFLLSQNLNPKKHF